MDWLRFESPAYWTIFTISFLGIAAWESRSPHRPWMVPAERRWTRHGILLLIVAIFDTLVLRISPVAAAVLVQDKAWGILTWPSIPFVVRFAAGFLLLDLVKYAMHWLFHHVAFLWPVHRVHHSDPDFDVSTAGRFHPIEPLLVGGADLLLIVLLAPPPIAVLSAKLAGAFFNLWEHANATLPVALDRNLRRYIMTPTAHRIHHAEGIAEQNRNLGEIFPLWDRMFGTYRADDGAGLRVGLRGYQNPRSLEIGEMLTQPFRRERGFDE